MLVRTLTCAAILVAGGFWAGATHLSAPLPPAKPAAVVESAMAKKAAPAPQESPTNYHAAALQAFEQTPGFGRGRMKITLQAVEDIHVYFSPGELDMDAPAIHVPALVKAHQDRIGLLSSGLTPRPEPPAVTSIHPDGAQVDWRLRSVDLLALVDHDEPVVYITAKLANPAAQHGAGDKTDISRGLDFFEMAALQKLRGGDDMFVRAKEDTLRMLGALRATKACLQCHAGKEGDLFGAFSYTLKQPAD